MADNHYGWFARVATGIYDLTPAGKEALSSYAEDIKGIENSRPFVTRSQIALFLDRLRDRASG